jgi:hypothetical protein
MLNTALPWATVLLIGFLPAVSEEGISRMFSISVLDRLGAGSWLAVVLPAFIWGFGHSTYANQPFYIRGLEVGIAGVLIGALMLRYGVVPLLVWHFTVDAIYTALLLLRRARVLRRVLSDRVRDPPAAPAGLIPSGPAPRRLPSGVGPEQRRPRLRAGGAGRRRPRCGRAAGARAQRTRAGLAGRGCRGPARVVFRARRVRGAAGRDAVGRAAARATAQRFLRANGADPDAWRNVVYQGTGFADDEQMRHAKPQDEAGIPGFSEDAARYVIEKGGIAAFRNLTETQLPPAYWVTRFYQPDKKEE